VTLLYLGLAWVTGLPGGVLAAALLPLLCALLLWWGVGRLDSRTIPTLPFYEQVLDFLVESPSPQEIIAFRPSAAVQRRFNKLLALNRELRADKGRTECAQPQVAVAPGLRLLVARVAAFPHR